MLQAEIRLPLAVIPGQHPFTEMRQRVRRRQDTLRTVRGIALGVAVSSVILGGIAIGAFAIGKSDVAYQVRP